MFRRAYKFARRLHKVYYHLARRIHVTSSSDLTPMERAQARLKAVENADEQIARLREQVAELAELREQWDAKLLVGTSDLLTAVIKYEGELISFALRAADKSVTKAAERLGVSYQTLAYIIESRHKELLGERSDVKRRAKRPGQKAPTRSRSAVIELRTRTCQSRPSQTCVSGPQPRP